MMGSGSGIGEAGMPRSAVDFPSMDSEIVQAISAAVSACATVAILITTAIYVSYTRRLWEETKRAAQQSEHQAQLAAQQVDLAGREARLRIRPYLGPRIEVRYPPNTSPGSDLDFEFQLRNTGPVPAQVSDIIMQAWVDHDALPEPLFSRKAVIFPGEALAIPAISVAEEHAFYVLEPSLRVSIRVEYSGPWEEESHVTELKAVWRHPDSVFLNDFVRAT
jgi:hypothetical protein